MCWILSFFIKLVTTDVVDHPPISYHWGCVFCKKVWNLILTLSTAFKICVWISSISVLMYARGSGRSLIFSRNWTFPLTLNSRCTVKYYINPKRLYMFKSWIWLCYNGKVTPLLILGSCSGALDQHWSKDKEVFWFIA